MVVGGGGLESDFSVHLWSKALAYVGTKLNKMDPKNEDSTKNEEDPKNKDNPKTENNLILDK